MLRMIARVLRRTSRNADIQAARRSPELQTNSQRDDTHQNSDADDGDGCDVDGVLPDPTRSNHDDADNDVKDWIKRSTHEAVRQ